MAHRCLERSSSVGIIHCTVLVTRPFPARYLRPTRTAGENEDDDDDDNDADPDSQNAYLSNSHDGTALGNFAKHHYSHASISDMVSCRLLVASVVGIAASRRY
jgi:hypothetical protein